MNRRTFLARSLMLSGVTTGLPASSRPVRIKVNIQKTLGPIAADFVGLGYEISSVSRPGLLSASNREYVELVRRLAPRGVIRIGGNTSDDASFELAGKSISAPKGSVINNENLQDLGSFLKATGWKLIWGLNLGSGSEARAVQEVGAVIGAAREHLLALEIGNEPDLFSKAHRPGGYGYENYLQEYRRYKSAIREKFPNVQFAGPDVAAATDWVSRFAKDEGHDLRLLTHHYYRECAKPTSDLDKLLLPDPKLPTELARLRAASSESRVPYRICETNSFCGGGKPGVSDTFGAALWVLEFMFKLALADCAGVNIETGVNQLGFISSYSPIGDDEHGTYSAKPAYYGMLAFVEASQGNRLIVDCESPGVNISSYAVANRRECILTVINKDHTFDADVNISIPKLTATAQVLRLRAPSLDSKDGITLGDSAVSGSGAWKPQLQESIRCQAGECKASVSPGSAAILKFARQ